MSFTIENEVLAKVADKLNTITDLPCSVSIKELSFDTPALFLRQTGGKVRNLTVAGSYDMEIEYELYYRCPSNSEKEILTAQMVLDTIIGGQLSEWNETRTFPSLASDKEALGYEITARSSLANVEETGELIYVTYFNFTYHQKID